MSASIHQGSRSSVGRAISTRFPEAAKATENALTNHSLIINSEFAARDPALLAKNTNLMRSYPILSDAEASGTLEQVANAFTKPPQTKRVMALRPGTYRCSGSFRSLVRRRQRISQKPRGHHRSA
jgi:hypothetical protein